MSGPVKAYKNLDFLNSPAARTVRILCEYEEPKQRFEQHRIKDTIVFFGSARAVPADDAQDALADAQRELATATTDAERDVLLQAVRQAERAVKLSRYYEASRELARRLTEWDMQRAGQQRYYVATGGGPGTMRGANQGAADVVGGRSLGLRISLPFEENLNPFVTDELSFEFHYFFMRKYWFVYLAKAMVFMPGGFGTIDEMFETLTLVQTGKVHKKLPMVLFGTSFWGSVLNMDAMVEWGTISPEDPDMVLRTDSVDEAFEYLTRSLEESEQAAAAEAR